MLKNYKVFKSQITKTRIASEWAIRMQETVHVWVQRLVHEQTLTDFCDISEHTCMLC